MACIHTAATTSITLHLALDPVTKPLTFLCFSSFAPPTYLAPIASCAVSKRNKEGLSADMTNTSVYGDDVLDCDVAHQSHVSAHLFPSLLIICESPGLVVSHHSGARTFCFKSLSLSLSLSLCLCLCVSVCGQTLNNDGLLSVWFNDEECLAYVRDAYFLNR